MSKHDEVVLAEREVKGQVQLVVLQLHCEDRVGMEQTEL